LALLAILLDELQPALGAEASLPTRTGDANNRIYRKLNIEEDSAQVQTTKVQANA